MVTTLLKLYCVIKNSMLEIEFSELKSKIDKLNNQNLKEKNNVLNFEEKIDELNQETESLIEEIDKWEM